MALVAVKKDRYGQTIKSDSVSSLQLYSTIQGSQEKINDNSVSFVGSIFGRLTQGTAEFEIATVPTFSSVSSAAGSTSMWRQPHVYASGTDAASNIVMQSAVAPIHLAHGNTPVCPSGFVLRLSAAVSNGAGRPGSCTRCDPNTYSLNPLKGPQTDPGCFSCPAGAERCDGGDHVIFKAGVWEVDNEKGIYLLLGCPAGHKVVNTSSPDGQFSHDSQACQVCGKGEECRDESCVTCSLCQPGKYKAAVGTDPCVACPANTYREEPGASDLGMCLGCQAKSSTMRLPGRSSRRACTCDVEYYLIMSDEGTAEEALSCQACPKGAKCGDGECALRNNSFTCTDGSSIVGEWVTNSETGQYELTSCPAGYELQTTQETGSADLQQCLKCQAPSRFILRPDLDSCQACPSGLTCHGDATLDPVVPGSNWTIDGAIFRLQSCPIGYYVSPKSTETFNAALQTCLPCGKGEECTGEACVTCSLCQPGKYKAAVSTDPCEACSANTFNPDPGATSVSFCQACPSGADTSSNTARTSLDDCVCSSRLYSTTSTPFTCSTCPSGAVCLVSESVLCDSNYT